MSPPLDQERRRPEPHASDGVVDWKLGGDYSSAHIRAHSDDGRRRAGCEVGGDLLASASAGLVYDLHRVSVGFVGDRGYELERRQTRDLNPAELIRGDGVDIHAHGTEEVSRD